MLGRAAMDRELDCRLQELLAQAVTAPARSCQRQQALTKVVRMIQQSGRVGRTNSPKYQEALQITWLELCQAPEKYDPERGSVITWFNQILKYRIRDLNKAIQVEAGRRQNPSSTDIEGNIDPIEKIPAPDEIPPMLEETRRWIELDPKKVLRRTHMQTRPDVTCQILLLKRFPPPMLWDQIAEELSLTRSAAAMFYTRKCVPLLRNFGVEQGYLDEDF